MQEIRTDSKAGRNGINDRTGPYGYIWKIGNGHKEKTTTA